MEDDTTHLSTDSSSGVCTGSALLSVSLAHADILLPCLPLAHSINPLPHHCPLRPTCQSLDNRRWATQINTFPTRERDSVDTARIATARGSLSGYEGVLQREVDSGTQGGCHGTAAPCPLFVCAVHYFTWSRSANGGA